MNLSLDFETSFDDWQHKNWKLIDLNETSSAFNEKPLNLSSKKAAKPDGTMNFFQRPYLKHRLDFFANRTIVFKFALNYRTEDIKVTTHKNIKAYSSMIDPFTVSDRF